jgi:hypothetical protein
VAIENSEAIRDRLLKKLSRERRFLTRYDDYFEGEQGLKYLAPEVREQIGTRLVDLLINLPRYTTDVYENRLDIEGFRFSGDDSGDKDLWSVWQHNDGDMLSQQAHRDSLAISRAYVLVGEGDTDMPLITAQSAFDAIHEDDPRTHNVRYGIHQWTDEDGTRWINLYYPTGRTTWFRKTGRTSGWQVDGTPEVNEFDLPRLVPLINDPRILGRQVASRSDQRLGRSVFHDLIGPTEGLNKILTDMMVSAEFHAMPRRWATGLAEDDFVGENGEALSTFEMIAGRIWGVSNKEAKFGQFPEANLDNFHSTAKLLVQFAFMMLGLPAHYLPFVGGNPASADAIRSSESQLVKRAERKQSALSTRWERVQRLVLLTQGKPDTENVRQIETMWGDPATPTFAQKADGTVKLVQAKDSSGRSIITVDQAREDLGYTQGQRDRMATADTVSQDATLAASVRAAADAERAAAGVNGVDGV